MKPIEESTLRQNHKAPFVFIVGRGRSGTTLLRAMLTSHSELAIPNETHFIVPLSRDRQLFEGDRLRLESFLTRIERVPGYQHMELDHDHVKSLFNTYAPTSYQSAIRLLFQIYADSLNKFRYGDKTPIHVLHIEYLARMFPDARFIHVIRDGRDVVLSNLDLAWGPDSVWEGAVYWKRFVNQGRRAGAKLGPQRYRELRYEDLIDDPEHHVRNLCDFVDLDFEPSMLHYFERADAISGAKDSHHQNLSLPPTKGLRDWRCQMEAKDVELFAILAGDLLSEMGYESVADIPRFRTRARAFTKWTGVQWRRLTRMVDKRVRRVRKSLRAV